ncbi:MAG: methyltransferase domain-containing protein [Bacteroidota bacterium]|nr:methyltransferase domain-containing protein [Bacteroidota bacterium]
MFKHRSYKKELLDGDSIPDKDLYQNLKELNTINNLLGGYRISFNALKKVLAKTKPLVLVDIGCGGGDTLKQIQCWNIKQNYQLDLIGIDLKQTCIDYSTQNNNTEIKFVCDDYKAILNYIPKVDIIHACLFCHHLTEREIVDLIKFCKSHQITLIINDLERNPIAYYAIKVLTQLFSKSYLVKNDAPLSVLRGFKKSEWKGMIQQAEVKNYSINYKWAFRHEVIVYAN